MICPLYTVRTTIVLPRSTTIILVYSIIGLSNRDLYFEPDNTKLYLYTYFVDLLLSVVILINELDNII